MSTALKYYYSYVEKPDELHVIALPSRTWVDMIVSPIVEDGDPQRPYRKRECEWVNHLLHRGVRVNWDDWTNQITAHERITKLGDKEDDWRRVYWEYDPKVPDAVTRPVVIMPIYPDVIDHALRQWFVDVATWIRNLFGFRDVRIEFTFWSDKLVAKKRLESYLRTKIHEALALIQSIGILLKLEPFATMNTKVADDLSDFENEVAAVNAQAMTLAWNIWSRCAAVTEVDADLCSVLIKCIEVVYNRILVINRNSTDIANICQVLVDGLCHRYGGPLRHESPLTASKEMATINEIIQELFRNEVAYWE